MTDRDLMQQEPVAWMHPDGRVWTFGCGFDKSTFTIPLSPPAAQPEYCDHSSTVHKLAEMVMSDCGHSSNNQRLLDRIANRIQRHIDATTPPAAQPAQELYNELLFAVSRVHPNETCHQTALRYIQQAESGGSDQCTAAHGIKEKNT
jgi:hypothetical protein